MRVLLLCFSFLILLIFSPTIRSKLIINTPWFSNVGKAGIPSPGIQSIPAVFRYPADTSPLAGGSTRWIVNTPLEPPPGQRCSGRNYNGRRCCTPEQPCGLGEGDCDGPLDGGGSDGHRGCWGDLVCGSNNCKKFGLYYHEKDDCCDVPSSLATERPSPVFISGVPLEPPPGQRCAGRNYNGRRCCTPQNPCGEGEGDCDGAGDGGGNDGNRGCRGDLVCGSNNCKKFGLYYHEKDDCCEKPSYQQGGTGVNVNPHWSEWGSWTSCDRSCGIGHKSRVRVCNGSQCRSSQENQERVCFIRNC